MPELQTNVTSGVGICTPNNAALRSNNAAGSPSVLDWVIGLFQERVYLSYLGNPYNNSWKEKASITLSAGRKAVEADL